MRRSEEGGRRIELTVCFSDDDRQQRGEKGSVIGSFSGVLATVRVCSVKKTVGYYMQVSGLGVKNGLGCVNRQSGQSTLIQLDNFAAEFTAENATEREI